MAQNTRKLVGVILMLAMLVAAIAAITVTSSAATETWVKTDIKDIKPTDVVLITWTKSGKTYAVSNDKGTGSGPVPSQVTVTDAKISATVADNLKWNITYSNGSLVIYPNGDTTKWLYCTSTNNGVRVGTNANKTFTIDATSGYLKHTGTSRYLGIYNTQDLRCYTSPTATNIKEQTLAFYVLKTNSSSGDTPCSHANAEDVKAVAATCTTGGYTAGVYCPDCKTYVSGHEEVKALGHSGGTATCEVRAVCDDCGTEYGDLADHNYVDGYCSVCDLKQPVAIFELGANDVSKKGTEENTDVKAYNETNNGYTLTLSEFTKAYKAWDASGNACLKLGSSSAAGTFTFTVPDDVTSVVIYVSGRLNATANVKINGGTVIKVTALSNNAEFDALEVDTTTNKTVKIETATGGYRAFVGAIHFYADAVECQHSYDNACDKDCNLCGEARETSHTPAAAVKENVVEATCSKTGSYDSVVYCSVCEQEISRKAETTNTVAHTPAAAVKENVVNATCTEKGSYDSVVYCSVCNETLDREEVAVDALGHKYDSKVTDPDCINGGFTTYTCSVCSDTYTGNATDALGHNMVNGACTRGDNDLRVKTYEDLVAALANGGTIYLGADITASEILSITKNTVLCGNGFTITSSAGRAINVAADDINVTIENIVIVANGERAINVIKNANVVINKVTATANNYVVNVSSNGSGSTVVITDSNLTGLNVVNIGGADVDVTVSDTLLTIYRDNVAEKYSALALNMNATNSKITATNLVLDVKENYVSSIVAPTGKITIDGVEDTNKAVGYISYGDTQYVAFSLNSLFSVARDGDTIVLLRDVELDEFINIYVKADSIANIPAREITLDLNGFTISNSDSYKKSWYGMIYVGINQTLNITGNGEIVCNIDEVTVGGYGAINLDNCKVSNTAGAPALSIYVSNPDDEFNDDAYPEGGTFVGSGNIGENVEFDGSVEAEGNLTVEGVDLNIVTPKGAGIRYMDKNGNAAALNAVSLRFGYQFSDPDAVIAWGWDYTAGSRKGTVEGVYMTDEGVTNVVFTNIAPVNFNKDINVTLWYVIEVNGLEVTMYHSVVTRSAAQILTLTAGNPNDAAYAYAKQVVETYNVVWEETAILNDEE